MTLSAGNAQSIGARSEQQDSFGFSDPQNRSFVAHGGVAAVVADGMGGLAHGSAASQTAVAAFLDAYQTKGPAEVIPAALLRAIEAANEAVFNLAHQVDAVNGLGTTLAAAVIHQDSLYWISAGDSRIYLYRDGRLTGLTVDHIYAAELEHQVARGEITQMIASSHPERASLTSYLGLKTLPKIEQSHQPFPVQPGDSALICSDGLYRALSEEEMAATIQNDAAKSCEALVQRAIEKRNPAQDNITVLALRCQGNAEPKLLSAGKSLTPILLLVAVSGILAVAVGLYLVRSSLFNSGTRSASPAKPAVVTQSRKPSPPAAPAIARISTPTVLPPVPSGQASVPNTATLVANNSTLTWTVAAGTLINVSEEGSPKATKAPEKLTYDAHKATTYVFQLKLDTSAAGPTTLKITLTPPGAIPPVSGSAQAPNKK